MNCIEMRLTSNYITKRKIYRRFGKRCFDIALSTVVVFLTAPVVACILFSYLFVWQKPIYVHQRIGRYGRPFNIYKFQTMYSNADELLEEHLKRDPRLKAEWEYSHKLAEDPRVTPLGKFLRSSKLDELPQFFNVLRGDMSIVGPRPITLEELSKYGVTCYKYNAVKPGVTGAWACEVEPVLDYQSRINIEQRYVKSVSLKNDLIIIRKTAFLVLYKLTKLSLF